MATQVQFRRGSKTQHNSFTGATGEITVDTTNKSIHVHDGTTPGGIEAARADLSNHSNVGVLTATTFSGNVSSSGLSTFSNVVVGSTVTINSSGINASGINTITTLSGTTATYTTGNLSTLNATTGNIVTGVVTTLSGTSATYTSAGITNLNVSGVSTFVGLLDANGGAEIDNIRIGIANDNEIDTSTGNLTLDSAGGTTTLDDNVSVSGTLGVTGPTTLSSTLAVTGVSTFTGNVTLGGELRGPAEFIIDPAAVGDNTGAVRIKGDLFVDGTQTIINSATIELADFIVGIASTATTDLLADGAGIKIGPDNTLLYDHTNTALKSSENFNLTSGKTYKINGTDVLSSTTLGSGVVNSSLTSVGTLTSLNVSGVTTSTSAIIGSGVTITSGGINAVGLAITATSFSGDGSGLSNTGSTLSAASGSQRVVVTSQTTGTMTASATDADLTFDASTNTLAVGGNLELGHATDTTISRVSAGVVAIEGVNVVTTSSTDTLTNKTLTSPSISAPTITGSITAANINSSGIVTATSAIIGSGVTITSGGLNVTGVVTATSFVGDGSGLTNAGSTLSPASGSQRVVVTSLTSGSMTAAATDADLTFDASTNTLAVGGNLELGHATDTTISRVSAGVVAIEGVNVVTTSSTDTLTNKTIDLGSNTLTFTSAQLATACSNETGSGELVFATSPTLTLPLITSGAETLNALGNTGATPSITLSSGSFVTATLDDDATFTFNMTGITTTNAYGFTLVLTNDNTAGRTITWPASVKYPNATVPTRTTTANKTDVYTFFTYDGGTTWWGNLSLYNFS